MLLCLSLAFFWFSFSTSAQTYPDTVENNGYVFGKLVENDMSSLQSGWGFADWIFATNECEFTPNMGQFNNGNLDLRIEKKTNANLGNHPSKPYWGAEFWSHAEYQYGRFVNRIKPHTPSGVVTSFFLNHIDWNDDFTVAYEWYEIDIEFAGTNDDVQFTIHWIKDSTRFFETVTVSVPYDVTSEAHDWIIEWTPTYISYYVDTTLLFTFDDSLFLAEQAHPQSIRMNCWISESEPWVGAFSDTALPVISTYEHIVVYELTNPDQVTAVGSVPDDKALNVFPNPFENDLFIEPLAWQHASYQLFDGQGRAIINGNFEAGRAVLDDIPAGMYVMLLTNKAGAQQRMRLVK